MDSDPFAATGQPGHVGTAGTNVHKALTLPTSALETCDKKKTKKIKTHR